MNYLRGDCEYRKAANVHYVCTRAMCYPVCRHIQFDVVFMSCVKCDDTYCRVG